GVSFGFQSKPGSQVPFNLQVGGFQQAVPPFGGFQPGSGLTGGGAFNTGRGRLNLGFEFSQGSRRSNVSQSPSVTLMNGQTGVFMDTSQSPFVISVVPVVGQGVFSDFGASNTIAGRLLRGEIHFDREGRLHAGATPKEIPRLNPTQPRAVFVPKNRAKEPVKSLKIGSGNKSSEPTRAARASGGGQGESSGESTAEQASLSLSEILQRKESLQKEQQTEASKYLEQGKEAAAEGKHSVAKIYYRMALRRAQGELKQQIQSLLTD
ncbi:MAG: hypothetical protein N2C14_25705, partial [Planctomycetales bacterium]